MITPLSPYTPEEQAWIDAQVEEAKSKRGSHQTEAQLRCMVELCHGARQTAMLMAVSGQIELAKAFQKQQLHPDFWVV
jgi:hypothetical protein